jgi:hypothetical protein
MFRKLLTLVLLVGMVSGCTPPVASSGSNREGEAVLQAATETFIDPQPVSMEQPAATQPAATPTELPAAASPTADTTVTAEPRVEATPTEEAGGGAVVGPDSFPTGINPLTGLPVENSENLALAPALVSVTNFPTTARPQAGLSFSPFVFEMYIGEGMTRFLAVFYGDYPKKGEDNGITLSDDRIGPVRSGRLPYESLRKLYNGFLVMSSASSVVLPSLSEYANIFGTDEGDINSALIPATKLEEIASANSKRLEQDALTGLQFAGDAPEGGKLAKMLWIPFNYLNQVIWRYDPASGAYHRYQDNADGQTFIQATDRLNGEPLTYENVVILFANHQARRETLIDIDLMYIDKMPALLFRDGQMYEIFWTTANGAYEKQTGMVRPIRFIDAEGNPFPLKPGQTWVEIVQQYTKYNETVDSEVYFDLKKKTEAGSGVWAIHFFPTIAER